MHAASEVASTPVGMLALVSALVLLGGFLGTVAVVWRGLVKPSRNVVTKIAEKVETWDSMVEIVQDLASTLSRYVSDTEIRMASLEQRQALVERQELLDLYHRLGPPGSPPPDVAGQQ